VLCTALDAYRRAHPDCTMAMMVAAVSELHDILSGMRRDGDGHPSS
jgi:hypothetical protein